MIENLIGSGSNTRKIIVCAFHTSLLTSLEDYLATKEVEFLYLGRNLTPDMSHKICMQFAGVPSYRVLIIDSSSRNFCQHFYYLKSSFPFGVPILFCESNWNVPRFEEPAYKPNQEYDGEETTRRDGSSQDSENRTSQPPVLNS